MQEHYTPKNKHLTLKERQLIEVWINEGKSDRCIAKLLGKSHPYCSQERGSNENHNRLIRRHLPKGTQNTTSAEVARIELWINNYPKRMFNYLTPEIVYQSG